MLIGDHTCLLVTKMMMGMITIPPGWTFFSFIHLIFHLIMSRYNDSTLTITIVFSRWTFYSFIHVAGILLMWDKAWVWDITQCWSTSNMDIKSSSLTSSIQNHQKTLSSSLNNSCVDVTLGQVGLPKPPH